MKLSSILDLAPRSSLRKHQDPLSRVFVTTRQLTMYTASGFTPIYSLCFIKFNIPPLGDQSMYSRQLLETVESKVLRS